ncbi:YceH family protein [Marinicella sediminis]|uniref:YceH family protein n=1 Tax=Marinicella sediminis TaxID=1792834 RepID=A0ABV7J8P9_9GAMM|nr:YceH family protein [Marinicella sediminis]
MTENQSNAILDPLEARVLACLMEKQLTTPNNYPLSMNSLLLACNQKTNRVPVMNLTEGQLGHTVNQLEDRKLVGVDYGGRANHVTHRVLTDWHIDRKQQAILAVLMVREPVTLNDIKTKTGRMEDFDGIDEVRTVLESLIDRDEPLVVRLPKAPGSREERYTHLLCGEVDAEEVLTQVKAVSTAKADRIDALEQRVEQLEEQVKQLLTLLD